MHLDSCFSFHRPQKSEALGLKWDNIDFKNKTLTVERTRDFKGVRSPKKNRSYRTILIDEVLINQLKVYRTWYKETKLSFGKHLKNDDFVFISFQTAEPVGANILLYSYEFLKRRNCPQSRPMD